MNNTNTTTITNSNDNDNKFMLLPSAINAAAAAAICAITNNSANNGSDSGSHFGLPPPPSLPDQHQQQHLPLPIVLILSVPAMLIILLTVFGNLLVLFFKARVGRTNTTLLVWNLGLTDFMVGVLVLPMGACYLLNRRWVFGHMLCRIWVGADVTFCTCSVVTICIISVDRYLAVTRPLRYKSVVTKLKVIIVIILIWTFSLGILLATVRWESHRKTMENESCYVGDEIRYLAHSVVFAFFLPASVTLTLYWRIYSLARNRQRALDRGFLMILGHNMNFLTNTLSQTTALRVHIGKNNGMVEHQRRVLRTHERIAKTLGVVSCSFLFCWLPFFTLYLLNHQCQNCVPSLAIDIASWLGYCNSMLNPIIYSFTVREFKRSAFRAALPIWRCVHGWCPRMVRKPPDAKATHRIARKRQQQISAVTQQQQKGVPATAPLPPIGVDGRKRRIPSRERLARARAGAIASLMVNTNCSIMQNTMTVELVSNKNKQQQQQNRKRRSNDTNADDAMGKCEDDNGRTGKNDEGEDYDDHDNGDKKEKEQLLKKCSINNTACNNQSNMMLLNGLLLEQQQPQAAKRSPVGQSKRSMIMLGENLNTRATTRRQSSLDELVDIRKYSDSGGELFSRSGLVTTTLLLATSESICGGGEQQHQHNSVGYSNSCCCCCYSSHPGQHGKAVVVEYKHNKNGCKHGCKQCPTAVITTTTTTMTTKEECTVTTAGSLPNSPSFSASSTDSDLTAEHSKYSVRMPCKFPVKKWKRRRHSMHGIPSSSSGGMMPKNNNGEMNNGNDDANDNDNSNKERERRKSTRKTGRKRGRQPQKQQHQQSHRKAALLFAAFKRVKNDGGEKQQQHSSRKETEEGGGEEKEGGGEEKEEGGKRKRSFPLSMATTSSTTPNANTTTTTTNSVGWLWERARAMASRRHHHKQQQKQRWERKFISAALSERRKEIAGKQQRKSGEEIAGTEGGEGDDIKVASIKREIAPLVAHNGNSSRGDEERERQNERATTREEAEKEGQNERAATREKEKRAATAVNIFYVTDETAL